MIAKGAGRVKNQRKLSTLLLHRVQREVGILVLVLFMIVTLSLAFLIHITMEQAVGQVLRQEELTGAMIEFLQNFKRLLLDRIFFSVTGALFVIGFVMVRALHRVAGPLNRIGKTLRTLGEGKIPGEITLREEDYFVELAEDVNQVIRRVQALSDDTKRRP